MKITFMIFAFLFALTYNDLRSQSGWFQLNSGTHSHLNDVVVLDSNTVIAAAGNYFVLRSADGGTTFDSIYLSLAHGSIKKLKFINANTGYLLSSAIYKTTDKGASWQFVSFDPFDESYDIDFINESTGIITGVDNWPLAETSSPVPLYAITKNGGINWNGSFLNDLGFAGFAKMFDENHINVIVVNRIHKTSNGGANWTGYLMPVTYGSNYFIQSNNVFYSSGFNGVIERTTNGGINWFSLSSGTNEYLNRVFFINENTGWAVGNSGTIVYTNNNGSQWSVQNSSVFNDLTAIHFIDENLGFAVGKNGVIIKTITGGLVDIISSSQAIPETFNLYQNYPNPFNPVTKIKFDIVYPANVNLFVYDINGKLVDNLISEKLNAGTYEYIWNAEGFSSGLYLYRLQTGEGILDTKRMVLLK